MPLKHCVLTDGLKLNEIEHFYYRFAKFWHFLWFFRHSIAHHVQGALILVELGYFLANSCAYRIFDAQNSVLIRFLSTRYKVISAQQVPRNIRKCNTPSILIELENQNLVTTPNESNCYLDCETLPE